MLERDEGIIGQGLSGKCAGTVKCCVEEDGIHCGMPLRNRPDTVNFKSITTCPEDELPPNISRLQQGRGPCAAAETIGNLLHIPTPTAIKVNFDMLDIGSGGQNKLEDFQRPHTSVGEYRSKNVPNIRKTRFHRPDLQESPNLTVLRAPIIELAENQIHRPTNMRCFSAMEKTPKVAYLDDKTLAFKSIKDMQRKLNKTLNEFETQKESQEGNPCTIDAKLHGSTRETGTRQTKIIPKNRFELNPIDNQAYRSRLKPLLYDEELDQQHSMGCTNQCKGCFRACLASDDYFDKPDEGIKVKRKVKINKRPLRVIKREFPELKYLMLAKMEMEKVGGVRKQLEKDMD